MNTPNPTPLRPRDRGLSLVELLVTLAIAALMMGMAAPSMAAIMNSSKLASTSNTFLAGLRLARSEAIRRGGRVAMCKSSDGVHCADAGGWEQGWIIFHDPNGNSVVDPEERLIQRIEAPDPGVVLTGTPSVARAITFMGNGRNRTMAGGMQAGTLTLCNKRDAGGPGRRIVISSGGRARVQPLANCIS
ncbi:prepilin-type N-terminal cleavage/methylation domain-containing protein [Caenimonas sedimenti]|uniref:Type II secretion system protein H n=1 Tax=Caenimonas sedimenti TaxID=2596921 RepID=A0A562ZLI0_9BURK|nr:Tfp pilus assembly protein FimT/FimU [Caenimonas sedimenti]TWO69168.1 prepilin-type N-terminal cleavage/methylation domain-containing protein [Caenimonas sedimenti]